MKVSNFWILNLTIEVKSKPNKLFIDADILAYRAAFSSEIAREVSPGYWTWHCDENVVREEMTQSIKFLIDRLSAKDFTLCLSDDKNFRKELSSTYKGQRTWIKKPLILKPIRKWLIEALDAIVMPSLEGDDVMGILATTPEIVHEFNPIIVSIDKDMKTIPSSYYRDDTLFENSEEEADYWHLFQTLTGDVADGYPGCPRVGKVTAKELLGEAPTWATVKTIYEKKGLSEEDALLQARLARILRYKDYDHTENKPIKWIPKNV